MKTKHAYLVIAHNEFEILKILISMLDDDRNDIYIHFDRKVNNINFKEFYTQRSKLIILEKRIDVRWGDLSQIKVELLLFETAYKTGYYTYFHLLSGVDLPIKTQDYIHAFFNKYANCEFVGYVNNKNCEDRILKYHLFTASLIGNDGLLKNIKEHIRNVFLKFQNRINYKRRSDIAFRKGANWVSITPNLVTLLLDNKKFILKRFKYTLCGDEMFIQSILWNSGLKKYIYNVNDEYCGCMRHIDWYRGCPYVWTNDDFQELKKSDKLFARKFSSDNMNIIIQIKHEFSK